VTQWPVGREAILEMLDRAELTKVTADRDLATEMVGVAVRHLVSADTLAASDPTLAYAAVHDAIRKSMAAVLQAQGLRATTRGGHLAIQTAFEVQFGRSMGNYLRSVNRIRIRRHELEYPREPSAVDAAEVLAEIPAGSTIVNACEALIGQLDVFI
jgi:hypothetical protein